MISEYIARHQAIIWTNAEILLIRTLGRNFVEILSKIHTFAFKKMLSAKWRQFCLSLKVLMQATRLMYISLRWRHNENDGVPNHQRLDIYSTVCSNADQRKHQNSASLAFVREIHRWPKGQRASNAENVSIWWRHHVVLCCITLPGMYASTHLQRSAATFARQCCSHFNLEYAVSRVMLFDPQFPYGGPRLLDWDRTRKLR